MGLETLVIISAVLSVVSVAYGMYMVSQQKGTAPTIADMQPSSLDAFQVTKVQEGVIVPTIYGRIRLSGNILYYDNLVTVANTETQVAEVPDGKSTKTVTQEYIASYTYYLSVWQLLCKGPATNLKTWVNDAELPLPDDLSVWATGVDNPEIPDNENITKLEGISWVYSPNFKLGINTTNLQTVHFLMESVPDFVFSGNKECSNGINPAYIIWCLLREAGADSSDMDEDSFIAAATYWNSKDYGLNVALTSQTTLRNHISTVLGFVSGYFGVNSENKFIIKAFDPDESEVDTLSKDDFIDFQISRKTWDDTYNTFTGNFIDEDNEYTKRTVSIVNTGNLNIQGFSKPKSIDLTAFRTREAAEARLWEIMKEQSYPSATISFSTFLDKAEIEIGSVITINHSDYGLDAAYYRIINKTMKEIDKNQIIWTAQQVAERVFDGNYVATAGSDWVPPTQIPEAPAHQRIFELPYNNISGDSLAFLLLSTKGASTEIGFMVFSSTVSGGDFVNHGTHGENALYGTLSEDYPDTTYEIDDDRGILFDPDSSMVPYSDVTRATLFAGTRYALIDDEIVGFQTADPESLDDYRLLGVVRGLFNTPIQSHTTGTDIWLFKITNNVFISANTEFYLKMVPCTASAVYDPAITPENHVVGTYKATKPYSVRRIEGIRDEENVDLTWWTSTKYYSTSAGAQDPGSTVDTNWEFTDMYPLEADGSFFYRINGGSWAEHTLPGVDKLCELYIADADEFTFEIYEQVNGLNGPIKSITIGTADGTYVS